MSGKNPSSSTPSGEKFIHWERDGLRHLKTVQEGVSGDRGGHAVLDQNGVPVYIRDTDGRVIARPGKE